MSVACDVLINVLTVEAPVMEAGSTCCGQPWRDFFSATGIKKQDLWDDDASVSASFLKQICNVNNIGFSVNLFCSGSIY